MFEDYFKVKKYKGQINRAVINYLINDIIINMDSFIFHKLITCLVWCKIIDSRLYVYIV